MANQIGETGIWIGGHMDALNEKTVMGTDSRITHILNVANDVKTEFDAVSKKYKYMRCEIDDDDNNITRSIYPSIDFMRDSLEKGNHVLVHCRMGVNRSVAIVLAYLVLEKGFFVEDAIRLIKQFRNVIQPRKKFIEHILSLSDKNITGT